jgi:putative DNA-invertase from lambdoid prophage Rac
MEKPVFARFLRDENGRLQLGQRVAIYCRVSTDDQSCERQERDLRAFPERAGHDVVGVYMEKASGARNDRQERKEVLALAQGHEIDAILVTELSQWGRSTQDPRRLARCSSCTRKACPTA